MQADDKTVDIDTSGPGAEIDLPEDKTFENEVEVSSETTENNNKPADTSEKSDEQLDVQVVEEKQETKKEETKKDDDKKSDDAKETADEVGEEEKVTEDKQAENEKEETKDE